MFANGTAVLKDLNSSNGTFVAGRRILNETILRSGDRLQVGAAVIEYRLLEPSGPVEKTSLIIPSAADGLPDSPGLGSEDPPVPAAGRALAPSPLEISADGLFRGVDDAARGGSSPAVVASVALAAVHSSGVTERPPLDLPLREDMPPVPAPAANPGSGGATPPLAGRHALAVPHPKQLSAPFRETARPGDPGAQAEPAGVAGSLGTRRRGVLSARPVHTRRFDHPPGAESPPHVSRVSRPSVPGGLPVGRPPARLGLPRHPGGLRPDDLRREPLVRRRGLGPDGSNARESAAASFGRAGRFPPSPSPASGCRRRSSGSSPGTSPVRSWESVFSSSSSGRIAVPCTTSLAGTRVVRTS